MMNDMAPKTTSYMYILGELKPTAIFVGVLFTPPPKQSKTRKLNCLF